MQFQSKNGAVPWVEGKLTKPPEGPQQGPSLIGDKWARRPMTQFSTAYLYGFQMGLTVQTWFKQSIYRTPLCKCEEALVGGGAGILPSLAPKASEGLLEAH